MMRRDCERGAQYYGSHQIHLPGIRTGLLAAVSVQTIGNRVQDSQLRRS